MASVETSYYDILLVGRTGFGKSTTANKLLGTEKTSETMLKFWGYVEGSVEKFFKTGSGVQSVTEKCKLLSNQDTFVRVLDTPGFADTKLTQEQGLMESNLYIFRSVMKKQQEFDLAFRRVLYFLPCRGPPERADGVLQEEIKVMHEFLGEDIFNIMVIVVTNPPGAAFQRIGFEGEDICQVKQVFTTAYRIITGSKLRQCPPVLYLQKDPDPDLFEKIKKAEVIVHQFLTKEAIRMEKLEEKPKTRQKQPDDEQATKSVERKESFVPSKRNEGPPNLTPQQFHIQNTYYYQEPPAAPKQPPAAPIYLRFTDKRCVRCVCELIYEEHPGGKQVVKVRNKDKEVVPREQSLCHPIFVPKHSLGKKFLGGIGHIATFGIPAMIAKRRGKKPWPGFANSEEICPACGQYPGSEGCTPVGTEVVLPRIQEKKGPLKIKTDHTTDIDKTD